MQGQLRVFVLMFADAACIMLAWLISVVTYLPLFIAAIIDPNMESPMLYITLTLILTFLLQAGITVGGYFLSTHLMKNKLNLP